MATYITLCNFTEKGAREIKDTLKRTEAAKGAAKQFGATIKEVSGSKANTTSQLSSRPLMRLQ